MAAEKVGSRGKKKKKRRRRNERGSSAVDVVCVACVRLKAVKRTRVREWLSTDAADHGQDLESDAGAGFRAR